MISIIGLGGAGGNIADESKSLGFTTGAINFSQEDLNAVDVQFKLRLPGADGVGRNRQLAANLFSDHYQIAINFVKQNFLHSDLIIIPFSASGGSGSGIAPIFLDLLTNIFPDKIFVAMPIFPDLSEVTIAQLNTLNTFDELFNLNTAIFPIDNQQIKMNYETHNKNNLYSITNSSTLHLISKMIEYTTKNSKISNLDKRDVYSLFNTKGIGIISEIDLKNLTKVNGIVSPNLVFNEIYKSWENSVFTPIEYGKVTKAGIILDADEKYIDYLQHDYIFSKFKNGMPLDLFEGYYNEGENKIYTILTGLSWCNSRLQKIDEIIDKNKNKIDNVINFTEERQQYKSQSLGLSDTIRNVNHKTTSVNNILDKYNRNNTSNVATIQSASEIISKYRR